MTSRVFVRVACLLASLGLASCGGGGGGGGTSPPPPPPPPSFLIVSPTTITAANVEGGTSRGSAFAARLTQEGINQFAAGETVVILLSSNTAAITNMDVVISGTTGQVNLAVDSTLPAGTYNGTITVRLCKDTNCTNQLSSTPVSFRYDVLPAVISATDTLDLSFVRYQDQTPPSATLDLDFSPYSALTVGPFISLRLDSRNALADSDVDNAWATFDLANDAITATVTDLSMPCGRSDGMLRIQYANADFEHTASLPVSLTVTSPPVVEYVHPRIGFTDRADEFLVTGCGFDTIDPADIRVGGVAPTTSTSISDREILITLPSGMSAGTLDVSILGQIAPAGAPTGQFVVKAPQARPDFDFDLGSTNGTAIWDEERERLLISDSGGYTMLQNTGTTWLETPDVFSSQPTPNLMMSADGSQFIALAASAVPGVGADIWFYNADTYALEDMINVKEVGASGSRHTIDKFGRLLLAPEAAASRVLHRVHSMSGTFIREVTWPDSGVVGRPGRSTASANRDVIFTNHDSNGDGWFRYDSTDDTVLFQQEAPTNITAGDPAISRSGEFAELDVNSVGIEPAVFDANLNMVGSIPQSSQMDDSSPANRIPGLSFDEEQNTAVATFSNSIGGNNATAVRYEQYDLTSLNNAPFQPINSYEVTGQFESPVIFSRFFISADGQTVFRIGFPVTIRQHQF